MINTLSRPVLDKSTRVAVIEDSDQAAKAMLISLSDFVAPERVPIRANLQSLLSDIEGAYDCAIFDHRLGGAGIGVKYSGAEAAYHCLVPSILVSTYLHSDRTSIRKYLAKIPHVLPRLGGAASAENIVSALTDATAEYNGIVRPERRAHETLVRVCEVLPAQVSRVRVLVPAWHRSDTVIIPSSMISEDTNLSLGQMHDRRFTASVNIYAFESSDLYFRDFVIAEEPPMEWMPANG